MHAAVPIRVLHVLARLDRGGTETWLLQVVRHLDRRAFQMDFVVNTSRRCHYDSEIEELGSHVFSCPNPMRPWSYGRRLMQILRVHGPYDVLHSHFDPCGYPLRWAYRHGIPVRIAHSHNPGPELRGKPLLVQSALAPLTTRWLEKYATVGLAASASAGSSLFKGIRRSDWQWRMLPCGIDLTPFEAGGNRNQIRSELQLPEDSWVVGHVGKFCASRQKNQEFVLQIARELIRRRCPAQFVFVGDGPRRPRIEAEAARYGLTSRVRFLGSRPDVARLLTDLFDLFLFPSLFEGLGLALVEAQAAGLPCIASTNVPDEADVLPELVSRLPLSAGPEGWADAALATRNAPKQTSRAGALEAVRRSHFNIVQGVRQLESFYRQCLSR